MINITALCEADRGRWVRYKPRQTSLEECGRIKGWSAHLIHVVYRCDGQWDEFEDYNAYPTRPEDLDFADETQPTSSR